MRYHDTSSYSDTTFNSSFDKSEYKIPHREQSPTMNTKVGVLHLMSCMSIDDICHCNILEINSNSGRRTYSGNNASASAATATSVTNAPVSAGKTKLSSVRYIETGSKNKNSSNINIVIQDNNNNKSNNNGGERSKNVIRTRGRSNQRNARNHEFESLFRNHSNKRYDRIRKALLLLSKNKKEDHNEEVDNENICTINLPHTHRQEKKNNRKVYEFGNDFDNNDNNKKVGKTHHSLLHKAMMMPRGTNDNSSKKQRNHHTLTIALPKFKKKTACS